MVDHVDTIEIRILRAAFCLFVYLAGWTSVSARYQKRFIGDIPKVPWGNMLQSAAQGSVLETRIVKSLLHLSPMHLSLIMVHEIHDQATLS